MGFLDPKQWLLVIGLCLASAIGILFWSARLKAQGFDEGYGKARAEYTTKALTAEREAREAERALTVKFSGALHESRKRELRQRSAAAALRDERDRLRDELAASQRDLSTASCASVRKHAATLSAVFGECAARLEELAGKAQGHASDALTLEQAWPAPHGD